jgi:hypothetical protein
MLRALLCKNQVIMIVQKVSVSKLELGQLCWAVPPRPCLGSIAVHDIRCTTVTPFIKDCLTETIRVPHMNHGTACLIYGQEAK